MLWEFRIPSSSLGVYVWGIWDAGNMWHAYDNETRNVNWRWIMESQAKQWVTVEGNIYAEFSES